MVTTIDKKTKALDTINKAINRSNDHFAGDVDTVIRSIPLTHLKQLLKSLYEMKHSIETNNLKQGESLIGIGKIIVDSWPYDSEIGNLIINASHEFKAYIIRESNGVKR
jgi:hypothetical protein